jgi:hypothetical protein
MKINGGKLMIMSILDVSPAISLRAPFGHRLNLKFVIIKSSRRRLLAHATTTTASSSSLLSQALHRIPPVSLRGAREA